MAVTRSLTTGMLIVDGVRGDGVVGVNIARDGVHIVVLPARGCFVSPADAREIARQLNEIADRVEARGGKAE